MPVKYTYSLLADLPNDKVHETKLAKEIRGSNIAKALDYISSNSDILDIWFKETLSTGDKGMLDGIIASHDGVPPIGNSPTNSDGRIIFHQTSRKFGLLTYFSGAGDSQVDESKVGGSNNIMAGKHTIGEAVISNTYFDLNGIENETNLHEGYLQWKDALNDALSMEIVPHVTPYSSGVSTNYNLVNGYLIVPASGDGDKTVNALDIKLVEVPIAESGVREGVGYWNADWNSVTKVFENIIGAPSGDGQFNIFGLEVVLQRFVNKLPLLGSGFMNLQTSDSQHFGHNMRVKFVCETMGVDHDWYWNASLVMHRKKTV